MIDRYIKDYVLFYLSYFITNETIFYRTKKVKILTHRVYE